MVAVGEMPRAWHLKCHVIWMDVLMVKQKNYYVETKSLRICPGAKTFADKYLQCHHSWWMARKWRLSYDNSKCLEEIVGLRQETDAQYLVCNLIYSCEYESHWFFPSGFQIIELWDCKVKLPNWIFLDSLLWHKRYISWLCREDF